MGRCGNVMAGLAVLAGLAGCNPAGPPPPPPRDPVVAEVLAGPLMTDPDLASQVQPGAVFVLPGPATAPLPLIDRSDDEIAAARAEAAALTGASTAPAPPAADDPAAVRALTPVATAARVLAQLRSAPACAASARYSALWGARLPAAVPIYPRGHLRDGAGSDSPGCRLRAVTYLTPVPVAAVMDFYWARAAAAGLEAGHGRTAADERILAARGTAGFAVYARASGPVTDVMLVTTGL